MGNIEKLVQWFMYSPVYDNGAYVAYYSSYKKGPTYPEITAYAISLSCLLYKRRGDIGSLERAEECAEYMRKISREGGIPSFSDNLLYTFDTGIYVSGLCDLYSITGKDTYLTDAKKSLDWLYSMWDGTLFSATNSIPAEKAWYHLPSVHLVKLAIPLIKASKYLGDKRYEKTALELLHHYAPLQTKTGAFKVNETSGTVMTHPHCYAVEGYLYAYHVLRDEKLLELARRGSDWLSKAQNSDGSFYRLYSVERSSDKEERAKAGEEKLKTSDATAQATRIWKLLGVNHQRIEKAYRYLDNQVKNGGLMLFRKETLKGKLFSSRKPVYSWPTFFYLHSLLLPFGQIEYCHELF
jgi:hypothetical protein